MRMLKIGPYSHPSQVIVAPMAGVTDQPFRNLCRKFGAYWLVSEMVTSDTNLWSTKKSKYRLQFHNEKEPRWIQIAGSEPSRMAEAAHRNVELGAQIIDINLGCPAKKVCNRLAGSALLRDEPLVGRILHAVVKAVDVPVTMKMRIGWSRDQINAIKVARIAEDAGIQLITVHGRTREDRFSGSVDYDMIGRVKNAVDIPVIGNGDINSADFACILLNRYGLDGVMMGRGVQGQPWLPAQVDALLNGTSHETPSKKEIVQVLEDHVIALSNFYGEYTGVRVARKHVSWYLSRLNLDQQRRDFNQLESLKSQVNFIKDLNLAA